MASALPIAAAPFTMGTSLALSKLNPLMGAFKNVMKTPTPPEAKSPATASSPAVQQAVAEATARRSKARGFFSTILSQQGSAATAPSTKSTFGS